MVISEDGQVLPVVDVAGAWARDVNMRSVTGGTTEGLRSGAASMIHLQIKCDEGENYPRLDETVAPLRQRDGGVMGKSDGSPGAPVTVPEA